MHFKTPAITLLLSTCLSLNALAQNVPVVDINQQDPLQSAQPVDPLAGRESLPPEQRLRLLEQQISNLVQMNLPAKIDNVQQQLQQLNGQLEVQAHDIQVLSDQVKNFYQDLDKRLGAQKTAATVKSSSIDKPAGAVVASENSAPVVDSAVKAVSSESPSADANDKIAQAQTNLTHGSPAASPVTQSVNSADSEKKSYNAALDLLSKKHTEQAITAFSSFVKTYPKGSYTPNAHYWLGELYNMKGKKDLAAKEYGIVIKQFPNSTKVPDSLLKLAGLDRESGKTDQALRGLQVLIHQYPHSSAAQQANVELQALKVPATTEADPE